MNHQEGCLGPQRGDGLSGMQEVVFDHLHAVLSSVAKRTGF